MVRFVLSTVVSALLVISGATLSACSAPPRSDLGASGSLPSASPSATVTETSAPATDSSTLPTTSTEQAAEPNDPADGVATDAPLPTPSQVDADGRILATVVLTRWSEAMPLEVGGYVQGVTEESGTCTLRAHQADRDLSSQGLGTPGPSGTDCGEGLQLSDDQLTSGAWQIRLEYSSTRFHGASSWQEVLIK